MLEKDLEVAKYFKKFAGRLFGWFASIAMISSLMFGIMPGTKTIAAMVVLPQITSPQALDAMGSEAKDLYNLAKQGLAKLVADNKPAPAKKSDDSK